MEDFGDKRGHMGVSEDDGVDKERGSFFILINHQAVELKFDVGTSGVGRINFEQEATDSDEFIKGLVALVVDETEQGNLRAASKVAGLLADFYAKDVLVLDAQMHQDDTLVGEMHFIEGDDLDERRDRALQILTECLSPSTTSQTLH